MLGFGLPTWNSKDAFSEVFLMLLMPAASGACSIGLGLRRSALRTAASETEVVTTRGHQSDLGGTAVKSHTVISHGRHRSVRHQVVGLWAVQPGSAESKLTHTSWLDTSCLDPRPPSRAWPCQAHRAKGVHDPAMNAQKKP